MREPDDRPELPVSASAFGCLSVTLFVGAVGVVLLFALAWGGAHCHPVPDCRRANEQRMLLPAIALLLGAILLHRLVRYLVSLLAARLAERHMVMALTLSLATSLALAFAAGGAMFALLGR